MDNSDSFQFVAIMKNDAVTIHMWAFVQICLNFSWGESW